MRDPKNAVEAYQEVAKFLAGKREKTTSQAISNHIEELQEILGHKYFRAHDIIVDAYYNPEKYIQMVDGEPEETHFEQIEDRCA